MNVEICEKIFDVISLCGVGIPAIFYATGVLYSMHKTGYLLKDNNGIKQLNPHVLFTSSSGGTIPTLLLEYILINDLHNSRDDWFEHYVIKTIQKIEPIRMAQLYSTSLIKSACISTGSIPELVRICNHIIKGIILDTLPPEIINGKQIIFVNKPCSKFKYNYVIDSEFNDSPIVSNDFTHLNGIDVASQIAEVMVTCCIAITFSYLAPGTHNDAALLIDNDILSLDSYVNLKNIYYYSLTAYDAKTNNSYKEPNMFTIDNFNARSYRIYNYRAINNLKLYVSNKSEQGREIKFNLITFPNKYNPIRKYNNKIYRDLVPNIFYQNDFPYILTFLGEFNGDPRMLQLMFLIGAFETMSAYGVSEETAATLTDKLPSSFKEALDDPYNVYFKLDPLSIFGRLLFMKF